jgi:hypothetical protein
MKHVDLTKPVMKRVAGFEKDRISKFRRRFTLAVSIPAVIFLVLLTLIIRQMTVENTFDMLALFSEDREIIAEFWRDTIVSFWYEVPQIDIIFGIVVLLIILAIIISTQHRRQVNRRKLEELKKYQ